MKASIYERWNLHLKFLSQLPCRAINGFPVFGYSELVLTAAVQQINKRLLIELIININLRLIYYNNTSTNHTHFKKLKINHIPQIY